MSYTTSATKHKLCLYGTCMTVWVEPDMSIENAVEAVAARVERETGLLMPEEDRWALARRLESERA